MKRLFASLSLVQGGLLALSASLSAQAAPPPLPTLVDIHGLAARDLRSAQFRLDAPQAIQIEAVGAEPVGRGALKRFLDHGVFQGKESRSWDQSVWPANAWILDADSREVVWEFRTAEPRAAGGGVRVFSGSVRLKAGTYEAYYAALFPVATGWDDRRDWRARESAGESLDRLRGPFLADGSLGQFRLVVRAQGAALDHQAIESHRAARTRLLLPGVIGDRARAGFELTRATELEIYGVGERVNEWRDYGWITEAASHKTVWSFKDESSEPAGGGARNRAVRSTLTLPAGKYLAYYVSDDSHHPGEWSMTPPADAGFWGLAVRVTDPRDQGAVQPFDYRPVPGRPIVALTGAGDDAMLHHRFVIKRAVDVQIFGMGEGTGDMEDYGWLVDANGRVVWRMERNQTEHAGGSSKNRVYNGTIRLEPGRYIAYYVSDGSHSAGDGWNSDAPYDEELWGLTIAPADPRVDPAAVSAADAGTDPSILAEIRPARDRVREHVPFRLAADGPVRIHALGEESGELVDYGWITDATGQVVWEMRTSDSEPAGGAEKNRMVDAVIRLRAGEYRLHYQSDDTHSFGDWNATPPDDPLSWGIAVFKAGR